MAVYSGRRRRATGIRIALGVALLFILFMLGVIFWSLLGPGSSQQIPNTLETMSNQIEVMRVSHYTSATVKDGKVINQGEYDAALEDLRRAREEWRAIGGKIDSSWRTQVEEGLDDLQRMVEGKYPADDVNGRAKELQNLLKRIKQEYS